MKGNEDLARSIIPVSSDPSGFSRGTRRTQKPLSSLWKVTRSIKPEICSVEGRRSAAAAFMSGFHFATAGWCSSSARAATWRTVDGKVNFYVGRGGTNR